MTNRYPLIEAGMSRSDCLNWWKERYDRPLERSACVERDGFGNECEGHCGV